MPTLRDVSSAKSGPYSYPLRVRVIAVGQPTSYGDGDKTLLNATVGDESGWIRAVCFDVQNMKYLTENAGIVLRNIISKNKEIIITKQSKIFQTTPPSVPEEYLNQARNFIKPPTPDPIPIAEAKMSPEKQRVSVQGKITNEGILTSVISKNRDTDIKTITLEDKSDEVKVTLWRNMAKETIHPGDFVLLSNVVINKYENSTTLSTTQYSTLKITEAPEEEIEVVTGYCTADENMLDLMLKTGTVLNWTRNLLKMMMISKVTFR